MTQTMTQIVVCAANSVTRAGLTAIATTPTTDITYQATDLADLAIWLQHHTPDLALIELPQLTRQATRDLTQIASTWPAPDAVTLLLLLETWEADHDYEQCLQAIINTGCISLLPSTASAYQVKGAIAIALTGLVVLHPEIIEILATTAGHTFIAAGSLPSPSLEPLTQREVEVLHHLTTGLSNKAIAHALQISEHTAKFHISAILAKLGASSRTEAVAIGIRAGLIML